VKSPEGSDLFEGPFDGVAGNEDAAIFDPSAQAVEHFGGLGVLQGDANVC
jgi:hypothetical protein